VNKVICSTKFPARQKTADRFMENELSKDGDLLVGTNDECTSRSGEDSADDADDHETNSDNDEDTLVESASYCFKSV
jgi:hypothetical protein